MTALLIIVVAMLAIWSATGVRWFLRDCPRLPLRLRILRATTWLPLSIIALGDES